MARTAFEKARRLVSAEVILLFVAAAFMNESRHGEAMHEMLEATALMLFTAAVLGRAWSSMYLSGRKSLVLCTSGPFSLTRNPLYFSSLLAAAGIGLLSRSLVLFAVLVSVFFVYYHFIIRHEEVRLGEIFGPAYEDYKRSVPRFFPRLRGFRGTVEVTVNTRAFMRSLADASGFLVVFAMFEVMEAFEALHHGPIFPVLWHLP